MVVVGFKKVIVYSFMFKAKLNLNQSKSYFLNKEKSEIIYGEKQKHM